MTGRLVLSTQLLDEVDHHLSRFGEKIAATCVMLIDISGQLISYHGQVEGGDIASLAALIASNMAAVMEMAKQIGERNQFTLLFHEGETTNILISTVGNSFLLAGIFGATVRIGRVRLFTRQTAANLLKLVKQFEEVESGLTRIVTAEFTASLIDEVERTFGE